jgi:hypothetical protein
MSVTKANAVEKATTWAACLHHQHNQSIHVTDSMTVMTLTAGVLKKLSAATGCLCQTALNWKLSCIFKIWCKFSSGIKVKLHKKKLPKMKLVT